MRKLLFFVCFSVVALGTWAFDFSQVCSSGQTLYYTINGTTVTVTCPGTSSNPYPASYERPSGTLVIPDSVTNGSTTYLVTAIGSHAFDSCVGITAVTIPSSVNSIGAYAFYCCRVLTGINIPNAVTTINEYTFYSCTVLADVELPDSLISVGESAFSLCYSIDSLAFPNSLQTIDDYAFTNCRTISVLVIPNSVTEIGRSAFFGSSNLQRLVLGNSLTTVGAAAFSDCYALERMNIPASLTVIPNRLFGFCYALDSVVIPNTVTTIGEYAFYHCDSIHEITIPPSVQTIGKNAFTQCQNLATVNFNADSCVSMGWDNSSGFTSVFSACVNFTTLNVGANVKCIPDNAFQRCATLTQVNFNAVNCSYMGSDSTSAFNDCRYFKILNFGDGVESIPDNAFAACRSLLQLSFPASIERMGAMAFYNCVNINQITLFSSVPPTIDSTTFKIVRHTTPVLVICGYGQIYRTDENWDYFNNIQEFNGYVLTLESEDMLKGTAEIVQAPDCETSIAIIRAVPKSRYAFDHWQDGDTTNPRTLMVTCDTSFTAYFVYTGTEPEGIDESGLESMTVTSMDGSVILNGSCNEELYIVDMMGRVVVHEQAMDGKRYKMPAAGVYLVRLGKHAATKVVVTR